MALEPAKSGPSAAAPDEGALLLSVNQAAARHRDRDGLIAAIAAALDGCVPAERLEVLLPTAAGQVVGRYAVPGGARLSEELERDERSPLASVFASRAACVRGGAAVLPLLVEDRCIGAIAFVARGERAWDDCPRRLLDDIASAVAVGLDHCLAYAQLHGMGQELKALLDVSAAVGRHLERDVLFGALAGCLRSVLPTDHFGIELPIEGGRLQGHLLTPRGPGTEPTQPTVLPARGTACDWVMRERQWFVGSSREALRERFPVTYEVMTERRMESLVAMPLSTGTSCRGALFFMAARRNAYDGLRRGLLEQVASAVAVALDDCLAHEEVRRLRDRLAEENQYLQEEIRQDHGFDEIVGRSAVLRRVLENVERVAPTETTVLIQGETGTGKELVARAIHARSRRATRPLIKVNCAAIPAGLVESELFGHEKGAFTGATARRIGRFELADGGTIFLDEVGELPLETQVKLLRVLQEREFERVGGSKTLRADVRVIAATNRDLLREIREGRFRQDLYYRLGVFPLVLPPLRERPEDIELLAHSIIERQARRAARPIPRLSEASLGWLRRYAWPGNVRELENVIEQAMILCSGPVLEVGADRRGEVSADRRSDASEPPADDAPPLTLVEVERQHLVQALERCAWVIEGPRGAARQIGLHPNTLRSRLKKLGLARPAPAVPGGDDRRAATP